MTTSNISAINHLSTVLEQLVEAVKAIKTGEPVDAYTKAEIDQKLAALQTAVANGYYTKQEIDSLLGHYKKTGELVNMFYIRQTIDNMLAGKADKGHTHQPTGIPVSIKSGHDASLKFALPFASFAGKQKLTNFVGGSTAALDKSPALMADITANGAKFQASRSDYVICGPIVEKRCTVVVYGSWNHNSATSGIVATDWKTENGGNPVDSRLVLSQASVLTWHNSAVSNQQIISSGVSTRVIVVFDGTTRKTYIDNLPPLTATVPDKDGTRQGFGLTLGGYWRSTTVGSDGVAVQNFVQCSDCTIKEVLLYNRALTPAEFPNLHDARIYNF